MTFPCLQISHIENSLIANSTKADLILKKSLYHSIFDSVI